jgi:hypothetical protein
MTYNAHFMLAKRACLLLLTLLAAACASSTVSKPLTIPAAWLDVTPAHTLGQVAFGDDGNVQTGLPARARDAEGEFHVTDGRIMRGDKELTTPFSAVESLDVSEERGEVAFSVKRDQSFDIGLVSTDGSPISWIPSDPADEIDVQWAPRGNKISFIVRTPAADFVRTLHVPTAYQFSVDVPFGRVSSLAWEKAAELYAIVVDSVEASQRVEVMKYDGTLRRVAIQPEKRLPVSVEPLAGGIALRPDPLKYGERVPLVIWVGDGDPNRWDDARGTLMSHARAGSLVLRSMPDASALEQLRATPWVDAGRMYVVDSREGAAGETIPGAITIRANAAVAPGTWQRHAATVETPPGVVKSFAAGFIADQLKGTSSPNASNR